MKIFNTVTEGHEGSTSIFNLRPEGKWLKEICQEAKLTDVCWYVNPFGVDIARFDSKNKTRIERISVSSNFTVSHYGTVLSDFSDHLLAKKRFYLLEPQSTEFSGN